MLEKLDFAGKY